MPVPPTLTSKPKKIPNLTSYAFVTDEIWMHFDVYHPSFIAAMATAQSFRA
jgi:hypothetical protein